MKSEIDGRIARRVTPREVDSWDRQSDLTPEFFLADTVLLAQRLLGMILVSDIGSRTAGIIVETEAYLGPSDPASHCSRGGDRARIFYRPGGTVYVYRIHQVHCFNIVSGPEGTPGAVLIRALAPIDGLPLMIRRRGVSESRGLCSGPGKLAQALGIDIRHNGAVLGAGPLRLLPGKPPLEIRKGPRIGISRAKKEALRFGAAGSPFLSRPL